MQPSYYPIAQLPGIKSPEEQQLQTQGITTTRELLKQARHPQEQQKLANLLHIHPQHVKKWVALADLAQIPSVGCQYCGLILHSGIASVSQLAQTSAPQLHRQILRLQVATMRRRDLSPSIPQVQTWIKEAITLTRSN